MKQQTAVEWLVEKLKEYNHLSYDEKSWIFEQANEMFEKQIMNAWNNGYREFYDGSSTPEDYYNQTFKSE
jgi:hypothetical protein